MREFFNEAPIPWEPEMTITSMLRSKLEKHPDWVQWERKTSLGSRWVPITVRQFVDEVKQAAQGFLASGVQKGDSVAILAPTSYEFSVMDFALWWIGAVPVAIYLSDSPTQISHIIDDADITMFITDNAAQMNLVQELSKDNDAIREILVMEDGALAEINRRGLARPDLADEVEQRSLAVRADDLATIIYTSGTTGIPKGVELKHSNFAFIVTSGVNGFSNVVADGSRTLLFLPLAHVFARFIEVVAIGAGVIMGHCPDTKNLVADMQSFKPTFLLTAPRVLEKVYNAADAKTGGGAKQKIFRWSAKAAIGYSRAKATEDGPSPYLRAKHGIANRLVLSKIHAIMGGDLEYIVVGGSAMSPRLGHFFSSAGFTVMEGYGLSETTAPLSVNPSHDSRIGTVGPPFPQVAAAISDEGEILVKGPLVFEQYRNDPELTASVFTEDGWFRTGDLGSMDDDGYITITGRSKDVIVTAGGKTVSPGLVEDRLRGHPLVSQAVCVGDDKPFIGALITIDQDMLPVWLKNHDIEPLTVEQAARDERVLSALDAAVHRANEPVSRAESIRKFHVLNEDFTEENNLLTPSLKVKRNEVVKRYAQQIAEMYGENVSVEE
ncbi:MAG TPA: AMP-binding protein [Actinomycetaceae bacterium]|nr:AMP-binding protein [Actinomycetaceae bacterium]